MIQDVDAGKSVFLQNEKTQIRTFAEMLEQMIEDIKEERLGKPRIITLVDLESLSDYVCGLDW